MDGLQQLADPDRLRPALRRERRQQLAEAGQARARGRLRKAIALYRALLAEDGRDVEVATALAEVLAEAGESFEAWCLYRAACKVLMAERRYEQCLLTFKSAARKLRYEFEAWRLAAELEQKMGRRENAYQTLLEGRRNFHGRFERAQAIELLRMARQIEPWDHGVVMDLARLYAQTDQLQRALRILESMSVHSEGRQLRELRWLQFQITLSLPRFMAWLGAAWRCFRGRPPEQDEAIESERVHYRSFGG